MDFVEVGVKALFVVLLGGSLVVAFLEPERVFGGAHAALPASAVPDGVSAMGTCTAGQRLPCDEPAVSATNITPPQPEPTAQPRPSRDRHGDSDDGRERTRDHDD